MGGLGSGGGTFTADCETLATDPNIGWRESSLTTDQEIVACLAATLGRPVGFGEQALGGYDPGGGSRLVVIEKRDDVSVEEQLLLAIAGDEHAWIVFDKEDFADDTNIGLYRAFCDDAAVQSALAGSAEECLDHGKWCASRGYDEEAECLDRFFNGALNDGDLPIRNPVIGSNKTIDGRLSNAHFLFSGFAIGSDSSGSPVNTSSSVILTHLSFHGAGHTEDHELDPDMIRSTGASHDIWIHKNDFVLTGDSAFDVKVGAYDITMSFNRVVDVLRATLHGSSDSREINEQITTTMHHNAFVSHDERYMDLGNTGRRVPLLRRGTSHMWNNAFFNYRKDIVSVRVAGSLLWENNALLVNESLAEKSSIEASLDELASNLVRDISDGNFRAEGTRLWFADATCAIQAGTERSIAPSSGSVDDLVVQYGDASRAIIESEMRPAGQGLVDYISKTAGKTGEAPFNSPLARSQTEVLMDPRMSCQD
jgi:pectate lyase